MLSPLEQLQAGGAEAFAHSVKPKLMHLLAAIGLDIVYERAEADRLFFQEGGKEVAVLDMLGGYGASLLGHNHPELVARAKEVLDRGRPFNAQASSRALAGKLGDALAKRVGRSTGRDYVVTLANSGSEAVEAAIKHAEIEMAVRIDAIHAKVKRTRKWLRRGLREHSAHIPPSVYEQAARIFDVPRVEDLDELFIRILRNNIDALARDPCFLAVESAFHGKSTGSLKLTNNPVYRGPWRRIGLRVVFLPRNDEAAIRSALDKERVPWIDLELESHESGPAELKIVERSLVNISACFVEPIQGEGGIRELPAAYMQALRKAADQGEFPLVVDEIQCGMGRCGTFLASETSVKGDYYLLSKTLGGGLAKVSALLVDRERYAQDYGYLHTSTFAEDDFSSAVALGVLELIDREEVPRRCMEKGERLLARLRELKARFPGELKDVRGRGLMVGVELGRDLASRSPLVRVLAEQNLLGFVASGHLLHEARVRVAPTLSAHATIRIEPSAFVSDADLDRFATALERLLMALRDGDAFSLARFLVGRAREKTLPPPPEREVPAWMRVGYAPSPYSRKVAFLGHFLDPGDLRHWDPSLEPLSDDECSRFLERTRGVLEPFVVDRKELRSLGGDIVNLTVIGLPFTAAQAMEAVRAGDPAWVQDLVEKAVALAKKLGCSIVGFGGMSSIVTDNCRTILEEEMALTSGNSLTAVAALEAVSQAVKRVGIENPRVAILGGAGNIGAVLAEVAADHVKELLLVGRPGATERLQRTAAEIYFGAWKRLTREGATDGLAGAIAGTRTVTALRADLAGIGRIGEAIRAGLDAELGEAVPVRISTDMDSLRSCNVILSATNAARPVIFPQHVGPGSVVIADVATPRDVDASVSEREDVVVLKGGLVKAPLGQTLEIAGMPLERGQLYGCLAETILLGFAGSGENFSYGRLTAARLRRIRDLARMHGFEIEERRA